MYADTGEPVWKRQIAVDELAALNALLRHAQRLVETERGDLLSV